MGIFRQTDRQTDIRRNTWTSRQTDTRTDRHTNGQTDKWKKRWINRHADRQTDTRTDGHTYKLTHSHNTKRMGEKFLFHSIFSVFACSKELCLTPKNYRRVLFSWCFPVFNFFHVSHGCTYNFLLMSLDINNVYVYFLIRTMVRKSGN